MNRRVLVAAALLVVALPAAAQKAPPETADKVLEAARKAARAGKKPILLLFDASW